MCWASHSIQQQPRRSCSYRAWNSIHRMINFVNFQVFTFKLLKKWEKSSESVFISLFLIDFPSIEIKSLTPNERVERSADSDTRTWVDAFILLCNVIVSPVFPLYRSWSSAHLARRRQRNAMELESESEMMCEGESRLKLKPQQFFFHFFDRMSSIAN